MTEIELQQLSQIRIDTRHTLIDLRTGKPYSVALGWLCHAAAQEIRELRAGKHLERMPNPPEE